MADRFFVGAQAQDDNKRITGYVGFFSQLAILPVFAPLTWLGLREFIPPDSWMNSIFFFFPF